jgi:hypothetical protein
MAQKIVQIRPQKGYQMKVMTSPADIVIGGGAAGVGKTFVLLMDALRHTPLKDYGAVLFRRTTPMIRNQGGLWDASSKLYTPIDGVTPRQSALEWQFASGSRIKFSHLEYEKNIYDWQGSEIPMIGFDELTHFTKKMFFYLLSRNRSTSGIKPYVRATCNPDPDSWVRELIDWWIGEDGFPIPERQGVVRYFMRDNDQYIWGDTVQEVIDKSWYVLKDMVEKSNGMLEAKDFVKSLTFIGGSIYDNVELLSANPQYLANLNAQSKEEKYRLLEGNWNVKYSEAEVYDYFKFRAMFTNHFLAKKYEYSDKYITTDIAVKGSDMFVVFVWQGKMLIDFVVLDKSKGNVIIDEITGMAYKHGVPYSNIIFDNDGVGQFVDGFIDDAREFNNGGTPMEKENYKNLKSQCYIKSGDAVERSEYYIPEHVANRPYNQGTTLKEQMLKERKAIKRAKPDYDGKLSVIPKHEMKTYLDGKSPDLLDAFMMREYGEMLPDEPGIEYF